MCPVTTPSENHVIAIMRNINCANIAVVSHNTINTYRCLIIAAFK